MRDRLTALTMKRLANTPGLHNDGLGLGLRVREGAASWVLRYMLNGRAREMGLGRYPDIGLADARGLAAEARRLKALGRDPIAERQAQRLAASKKPSFAEVARTYIASHKAGWRSPKQAKLWEGTFATYANPIIGGLPVDTIDTSHVLKILEPIWTAKPETAGRVRQRVEAVFDFATARGHRSGENPARWRGHLDKLLPAKGKVRRVVHHAALPYADMPAFVAAVQGQGGVAARALEFLILTAARTSEVLGARWDEIDLERRLWTIPAERMKAGREHRVPLCDRAVELLGPAGKGFVFPGAKEGRPLSSMAFLMLLRRMKREDVTTHGFRSTFRDWAGNETHHPREVAEAALAHVVGDKAEQAYRRGDALEKRRKLMDDWAAFCAGAGRP